MADFVDEPVYLRPEFVEQSPVPAVEPDPAFRTFDAISLDLKTEPGELAPQVTTCVRLDLEDIECFTPVGRQYEAWGVQFTNAIAIRPSNPVYAPHSGDQVMLGAPENGWIEATFVQPVQYVSSFITSSRRIVMRAFNHQNQLIAQTESLPASSPGIAASTSANVRLSVKASNIHRITFEAWNGHLTLDDFCFSS